ncbi:hypothetical protein PoB_004168300 [Plakobranchus ocellatus]|uniref:Uncharacterized protein n=1 Tax=Plakobranchus ocellatus TaxID=259542 RepID=A0AAV4B8L8_9GAST|nr:hypothetical protein PoB_004168300 [Plakobranchus ocellatus]
MRNNLTVVRLVSRDHSESNTSDVMKPFISVSDPMEKITRTPKQGDLKLSGPPSGQGAGGGARTRDRKVFEDLKADSLAIVRPTPRTAKKKIAIAK